MTIKNFKSTEALYGVSACYFENLSYFDAIAEKIKLSQKKISEINSTVDYKMPDTEYRDLNRQINECQKALSFNNNLINEYKLHCKNK